MADTREELMNILKQADAAGDTEAAQAAADRIQALDAGGGGDTGSPTHPTDEKTWASTILSSLNNNLRAFNRGLTRGAWDNITGGVYSAFGAGSPAEERAKTAVAKDNSFLHGSIPEAVGGVVPAALQAYFAPSTVPSTLAGSVGIGAVQSGIEAEMDRKDPLSVGVDMGTGGLFGGALHGTLKALGPRAIKPPDTATKDLNSMTQSEWDQIKDYAYPRQALDEINRASHDDASFSVANRPTGTPMTATPVDKPSAKYYEKFADRFNIPRAGRNTPGSAGTPIPVSEVDKWKSAADDVGSDYTDIIGNRLEDLMQNGPTMKLSVLGKQAPMRTPESDAANTDTAYSGILAARKANARADASRALDEAQTTGTNLPIKKVLNDPDLDPGIQEILRQANKGNNFSRAATVANSIAPNLTRAATGAATGYLGLTGAPGEAIGTAAAGFGVAPFVEKGTSALADAARQRMLQQVRDRLTGAVRPSPDTSVEDRFRRMLLGAWSPQ